jgi:pyrroloquinoline quinone biosynthesis protein D
MRIYRNPDVLWREEDEPRAEAYDGLSKGDDVSEIGTSVLFSDGIMVSLNILGTEIWKQCEGKTLEEIVSALTEQFDVAPEVLREDTVDFLKELEEKGFLRYED